VHHDPANAGCNNTAEEPQPLAEDVESAIHSRLLRC
jgi:hypothetical protein